MTKRLTIQEIKKKTLPVLKPYGVTRAGLFGSFARGEASDKSDVDLLVEITKPIGLFEFVGLQQKLEDVLGRPVDLVEYQAVKPALKNYIFEHYQKLL